MYLVFDLGGTFIKYATMDTDGNITNKGKTETPAFDGVNTVHNLVDVLYGVYNEYKNEKGFDIEGIAMSLPGQVDVEKGYVYGGGALRYIDKTPLGELVSKKCDGIRVAMENDGKCAALAEVWLGNAKDVKDAVVIVLGTGVGGGIVLDRKIRRGNRLLAGEISYILGDVKKEDIDNYHNIDDCSVNDAFGGTVPFLSKDCATIGVCYSYAKKKGVDIDSVSGEKLYKWAAEGDEIAEGCINDMYVALAKTCMSLYVTIDPDIILIGGGISAAPQFIEGVKNYIDKLMIISPVYRDMKVDLCKFYNDSNLLGALYNYMQKYEMV